MCLVELKYNHCVSLCHVVFFVFLSFIFEFSLVVGHIQAQTGAQRFAKDSGLNNMFPGNGVQRGLIYVFSCLVGV